MKNRKLTLTIEQEIIERAKKYAKDKNRSLSDLVENYLKMLTGISPKEPKDLGSTVKSLRGSFKAPSDFDTKKEKQKRLEEKYL